MVDQVQELQSAHRPAIPALGLGPVTRRTALYGALGLTVIAALAPVFYMVSTSLMTLGLSLNGALLPKVLQWSNYVEAWTQANFAHYFVNSVIIAALTIAGQLLVTVPAAYAFARLRFPGRGLLFALVLATLMIPETVTFIPQFMIVRGAVFPLPGGSWLNTLQSLTVPFFANALALFLLRQFFARIPVELWEAARLDNAGHVRFLLTIVVPMSRPVILTVVLLAFITSWNSFLWPLLVTTSDTWRPLTVALYSFITEAGPDLPLLMAGSVIVLMPVLILYLIAQRHFTEGIATTGLKG